MTSPLLDTAPDLSILGGHTRVGHGIRSRGWTPLPRMDGKVVLITGAASGLGLAAADGFARLGARVWLAVRNREREAAQARILEHLREADVHLGLCDLSRLDSVRQFAERFTAETPRLDVPLNTTRGVLSQKRELSADGIERTLATNVIGPFLLTQLLIGVLERSAPSRIVRRVLGMYTHKLRVDDLQSEQWEFDGPTVYARTKRAEAVLTEMGAQRLAGTRVAVHAMHPGWADTPGVRSSRARFYRATRPLLRNPDQEADTIVWLGACAEPAETSGGFWHDRRRRPIYPLPGTRDTEEERDRMWSECVALRSTSSN